MIFGKIKVFRFCAILTFNVDEFIMEADKSLKFIISGVMRRKCLVCKGNGHYAKQCSVKARLDENLRTIGLGSNWGSLKSNIIMKNFLDFKKEYKKLMIESRPAPAVTNQPAT